MTLALAAALLACLAAGDADDRADHIRSHYAKFEYRIPMRDGVRLFTSVYVPVDASETKTFPVLMTRTPYSVGPYGADRYRNRLGPAAGLEREGYIFVWQDVRGRYMSEGDFVNVRPHAPTQSKADVNESTDTYDTIDWLLKHLPYDNGKVGLWGLSYGGFYASAGMIDAHPALAAVSPQAPIADWFWDDMHRHGAFNLQLTFAFFSSFGVPRQGLAVKGPERFDFKTPDGYRFFLDLGPLGNANERHFRGKIPFWNELVAHPNYDRFWQERNILPHLKKVAPAVLTVGGWFDTEDLYGPLQTYAAIERQNPAAWNALVLGPWAHGDWILEDGAALGEASFGSATSTWYQQQVLEPFFLHHLKGGAKPDLPEAMVFETGANRWRRFPSWPPPGRRERSLYLAAGGALSWDPPAAAGADEYLSDPAKPVPHTLEISSDWSDEYAVEDQRFAARRPDVLVYETAPLEDDLTVAGAIDAEIYFSTTATDADLVVKLIDVFPGTLEDATDDEKTTFPGGRQMLVRGEPFRVRFRRGYETPVPLEPGKPEKVRYRINDVFHTFQRGHRVMVQVQSTWFPFIDRNPQTFLDSIFAARPEDFVKATHRVHRSPDRPSRITVGVLP